MRVLVTRRQVGGQVHRRVGWCCALVLLLLIAHAALMASREHIAAIGPLDWVAPAPCSGEHHENGLASLGAAGRGDAPSAPHSTLGDCLAVQAILPLLLALLSLNCLVGLRAAATRDTRRSLNWHVCLSLPPTLPPARRRALLQVFLN